MAGASVNGPNAVKRCSGTSDQPVAGKAKPAGPVLTELIQKDTSWPSGNKTLTWLSSMAF
jgi:hypothetical protein